MDEKKYTRFPICSDCGEELEITTTTDDGEETIAVAICTNHGRLN